MGEASWLSPIIVILKKNKKFEIYVDFWQLNDATKKDPYPLFFTKEVLDEMVGHEVYSFLDGFFEYHQIMIAPKDRYKIAFIINWGAFVWVVMPFRFKNVTNLSTSGEYSFQRISWGVHETIIGWLQRVQYMDTHLLKLQLCFNKCREFDISLNPEKCMFLVHLSIILGYVVSKESKLPDLKRLSAIVHMSTLKTPKEI